MFEGSFVSCWWKVEDGSGGYDGDQRSGGSMIWRLLQAAKFVTLRLRLKSSTLNLHCQVHVTRTTSSTILEQ
jgi:hypothetical protein